MLKMNKKNGLTLLELLVSTALIGIVMLGAVSVDYAINSSRRMAAQDIRLSIETQTTMTDIARNAELALGDSSNRGVRTGTYLCVRQDLNGPHTPNSYGDDMWICYWRNVNNIHKCNRTAAVGPGNCVTTDPVLGTAATGAANFTYTFVLDSITRDIYLEVKLTNRSDPSLAQHPVTNPEFILETRITPIGHSF